MQHLPGETWNFRRLSAGVLLRAVGVRAAPKGAEQAAGLQELRGSQEMGRWGSRQGPATLALIQVEADELLDAPAVLELGGAAASQGPRLASRRLGLTHLLGHARQTETGGGRAT